MTKPVVIRQIEGAANNLYSEHIDVSNISNANFREDAFHTRSLVALYLQDTNNIDPAEAAACITDGPDDQGVDGIYVHPNHNRIFFVQAKWRKNPESGVSLSEFNRFRDGVEKLINGNLDGFSEDIKTRYNEILAALTNIDTKITVAFVTTSAQKISEHIEKSAQEFCAKINAYSELIEIEWRNLEDIINFARASVRPDINETILLQNFGRITEPFESYFGVVSTNDLAKLAEKYGNALFSDNLRYFLEDSDVNKGIAQTLHDYPGYFWYYNNGVTAICSSIKKQPQGGGSTEVGLFNVEGLTIINGAQTVGTIARFIKAQESGTDAKVLMRIISLEGTPIQFSSDVTKANNTQNDLTAIDFVSQDPQQERLRIELAKHGIIYVYRRGDSVSNPNQGFDIRTATVALACSKSELRLAVFAKRYISSLWSNIKKEPYTTLFNDSVSGLYLWNLVQVTRSVDQHILQAADKFEGRERLIPVHGNRFLLHCIFNSVDISRLKNNSELKSVTIDCINAADTLLAKLIEIINMEYSTAYPGNIFKNQERQSDLKRRLLEA